MLVVLPVESYPRTLRQEIGGRRGRGGGGSGGGSGGSGGDFFGGDSSPQLSLRFLTSRFLVEWCLGVGQRLSVQACVHGVEGIHAAVGANGVLDRVRLRPGDVSHVVGVSEVPPRLQRRVHLRHRPPSRLRPLYV